MCRLTHPIRPTQRLHVKHMKRQCLRLSLVCLLVQDINALVKVKNPSLLLQLQKTPPSQYGQQHHAYSTSSPHVSPLPQARTANTSVMSRR